MNLNGLTETQIDAEIYRRSFYEFTKEAWQHVDPSPFVDSKYIEVLCSHAQWVIKTGETLVVNIPPRHAKSKIFSVLLNAWVWSNKPEASFLASTHSQTLTLRDARLTRQLVKSSWYVNHFGDVGFQSDQDVKSRYVNASLGSRQSVSVTGGVTGDGADVRVADDLLDASDANSEGAIEKVNTYLDEVFSTRVVSPDYAPLILVMQRLAIADASGHLMKQGAYVLCLPTEYDPEHPHLSNTPPEAWPEGMTGDWRQKGDLLCPERFSPEIVAKWKLRLGNAASGQLNQYPVPPSGGIVTDDLFGYYNRIDLIGLTRLIITADTAEKTGIHNAYSVFGLFAVKGNDLYVLDLARFKAEIVELLARAGGFFKKHHGKRFDNNPPFSSFEIEDKSSGTQLLQAMKPKYGVTPIQRESNMKKWERLESLANRLRLDNGRIMLPSEPTPYTDATWVDAYKNELKGCQRDMDNVGFWDQADVTSDAGDKLILKNKTLDASLLGIL